MAEALLEQHRHISYAIVAFDDNEEDRKRKERQEEDEILPYMRNIYGFQGAPQVPLQYRDRFGIQVKDPQRNYCVKLSHMFSWEIVDLAHLLNQDILASLFIQMEQGMVVDKNTTPSTVFYSF